MSERTAVYRMYDASNTLLYVGVAKTFGKRWSEHSRVQPWWPKVHRQTVEWFPTRAKALEAEAIAIRDEDPRYNAAVSLLPNGLASSGTTPPRQIRIDPTLWDDFGAAVGARNRSALIRDFVRWYMGETDRMPERPEPSQVIAS